MLYVLVVSHRITDLPRCQRHDRVLKHSYFNAGIGFDWSVSDKYELFGNMFTMLKIDQTNDIEFAASIGFTRYFSVGD